MGDASVQKKSKTLREWINTQPHLPQDLDDKYLLRFLHSCYYDIDKTKACIEFFFTLRAASPELVTKRDPLSKEIQKFLKIVNLAFLKISKNRNLWIWQLNDPGLEHYEYLMDAKIFFLVGDIWLLDDNDLEDEDIVILDVKDISLKFITKFNVSVARKLSKYQEVLRAACNHHAFKPELVVVGAWMGDNTEALPIRLKQIHVVNAPSFIDKLHSLLKPFMKQEYNEMVHFHKPNSESLYKYIDRAELPDDFGGSAGNMCDLMTVSIERIMHYREFFLKDDVWIADESKRTKPSKNTAALTGTFRSLAID